MYTGNIGDRSTLSQNSLTSSELYVNIILSNNTKGTVSRSLSLVFISASLLEFDGAKFCADCVDIRKWTRLKMINSCNTKSKHSTIHSTMILFSISVILLIIVFIVNTALFINKQVVDLNYQNLIQIQQKIDTIIDRVYILQSQAIRKVWDTKNFVSENTKTIEKQREMQEIRKTLLDINCFNKEIKNISVLLRNGEHITGQIYCNDKSLYNQKRLQKWDDIPSEVILPTHEDTYDIANKNNYVVSFVKKIHDAEDCRSFPAIVQIDLNYECIRGCIDEEVSDYMDDMYVVDNSGCMISCPNPEYLGSSINTFLSKDVLCTGTKSTVQRAGNLTIFCCTLTEIDWTIIATMNYNRVFLSILQTQFPVIGISILFIIFVLFFSIILFRKYTLPLERLKSHMNCIDEEDIQKIYLHSMNHDIQILEDGYNNLIEKIQELVQLNAQKERQRVEAEFRMHVAQINPHFLFNTLDSIRVMAIKSGEMEISNMVRVLSAIFKYNIDTKTVMCPLQNEIDSTQNYIFIQKYRMKDRLECFFSIEDGLGRCYVPKFILQPLIENSIKHGVASPKNKLRIHVIIKHEAGNLIVLVKDNGIGMSQERLNEIRNAMLSATNQSKGSIDLGIGLINVHERVRYLFGDQYGLIIERNLERGMTNKIRIPLIWNN